FDNEEKSKTIEIINKTKINLLLLQRPLFNINIEHSAMISPKLFLWLYRLFMPSELTDELKNTTIYNKFIDITIIAE
ncbi:TPA: hypothetical protein ACGF4K_003585, partial [Vibrio cholerae]